jgi:hypothetical protein
LPRSSGLARRWARNISPKCQNDRRLRNVEIRGSFVLLIENRKLQTQTPMIEILPESQGKFLGLRVRGQLTGEDYRQTLMPRLAEIIREQGRARVLLLLGQDFEGFETQALMGEDFGRQHRDDFEKIAVVGASWLVSMQLKMMALVFSGEVQNFSREELPQAWEWVKA